MQVLDAVPTDAQLAVLLDAEGRSVSVQVDDTPAHLITHPRGFPLWFAVVCVAIPLAVITAYVVYEAVQQRLRPFDIIGLTMGCLAALVFIELFCWMNRQQVKHGKFFVLDKMQHALALPRSQVQLRDGQIQGFVEVHAWYTVQYNDGSNSAWLAELSVLVPAGDGKIARYPVITCQRTDLVRGLGESLAKFFGVERRVLRLNWRMRWRLPAELNTTIRTSCTSTTPRRWRA